MNTKNPILPYTLFALLLLNGLFLIIKTHRQEARINALEQQLAHLFDPRTEKIKRPR